MFINKERLNEALDIKIDYFGVIAQLGAKVKTTSKCCFYLKWRSFVNEQARLTEAKRIYKTSDRSDQREQEALE